MSQPLNGLALLQRYQAQDQARRLGEQRLQMAPIQQQMLMEEMSMKRQAADRENQRMGMLQKLQESGLALKDRAQGATERYQQGRLAQMAAAAGRPRPQPVPSGYRPTKDGLEAIPGGPADLKAQAEAQKKATGADDVGVSLTTLRDAYDRLETGGGITSTKNDGLSNVIPSLSSSGPGQLIGKMFGTQNQSARNDVAMARPSLLASLMKATGMSAKQMDSNAELKLWLSTATDPTLDVQANRRALDNIERKYISGGNQQQNSASRASSGRQARISSDAEYNLLPSGAVFIAPDGSTRTKP